jgi:hypothetical protein
MLALASFAGCIIDLPGDDATPGTPAAITKKVVATIEPDRMERDEEPQFEDYVKTRFEYRHEGADVAADQVTVEFLGEDGKPKSLPMDRFTTQPTLRLGDVITIGGANLTSGLLVRQGVVELAKRTSIDRDWFNAQGAPIPLTSTKPGVIDYTLDSEGRFDFEATNFDTGDGGRVHFAKGALKGQVTGTATLRTLTPAQGPRIEIEMDGVPDVDALIEARLTQEGRTYDTGMRIYDDHGSFHANGMMQFDAAKQLRRIGQGSRQTFDMKVQMWDQDHSRASNYEPEDIDHPLLDESGPYEEEDVEPEDSPPAWVVEFLERIWSTSIAVGDDYRLHFDFDWGGESPHVTFDLILQVAGQEDRKVGGTTYPTYRVSQVGNLVVDPQDGTPADFELTRSAYWISTESYLPVYAQSSHTQTFNREKINTLFALMGEEAPDDLPDTATLALTDKSTISMKGYSGDLGIAPIVGLMSANQGMWTGGMGAASLFFLVSDIGGQTASAAPSIAWNIDEASDRLQVSSASSNADWNRISFEVQDCDVFPAGSIVVYAGNAGPWSIAPNKPASTQGAPLNYESAGSGCGSPRQQFVQAQDPMIRAGDFIELCVGPSSGVEQVTNVQVRAVDTVSNTVLLVHTFTNIARC